MKKLIFSNRQKKKSIPLVHRIEINFLVVGNVRKRGRQNSADFYSKTVNRLTVQNEKKTKKITFSCKVLYICASISRGGM